MTSAMELQMPEPMPPAAYNLSFDVDRIANVLSLQRLEVDDEPTFFGPSISSSFEWCCYN